jgi:antitoxin CptB
MNKLNNLKKKLLYRASYRGTKEMDILLGDFVNYYIDKFNEDELNSLNSFLNLEDEIIYSLYNNSISTENIKEKKIANLLKNFRI